MDLFKKAFWLQIFQKISLLTLFSPQFYNYHIFLKWHAVEAYTLNQNYIFNFLSRKMYSPNQSS